MLKKKDLFLILVINLLCIDSLNCQWRRSGNFFIDPITNQTKIFHGVNAVVKLEPFVPSIDNFDYMNS